MQLQVWEADECMEESVESLDQHLTAPVLYSAPHLCPPFPGCRCNTLLRQAVASGALPIQHPAGPLHLCWLLRLSPLLRTALPHICGQVAYQQAMLLYRAVGVGVGIVGRGAGQSLFNGTTQQQGAASGSAIALHAAPVGVNGSTPVPRPALGDGSTWQLAQPPNHLAQLPSQAELAVPPQLRAVWEALTTATSFCQRCSRHADSARAASGHADSAAVFVEPTVPSRGGEGQGREGGRAQGGGLGEPQKATWQPAPVNRPTAFWLQLLEVSCLFK